MGEVYNFAIAIILLALAIPLGNLLAKATKEELHKGRKWFKLLMIACLIGSIPALIFRKDVIFFSLLFIAVVTSRSVKK